jgi:putative ABC exporter
MIDALVFLELQRFKNSAWQKIARLRQPRYLFGGLAAVLYIYLSFFRLAFSGRQPAPMPAFPAELLESVGAFFLLLMVLGAWIFPGGRAALRFSEAEIAFLFPAPISRRMLLNYKILRAQLGVLFTALFISFIAHRWSSLGGPNWVHLLGWWLILSFLNLHLIGAAFTRDRLLDVGLTPLRRRILGAVLVAGVFGVSILWLHNAPTPPALTSLNDLRVYLEALFATPPLKWALWPLRGVVRPFLAVNAAGFAVAAAGALGLIALEYFWVIKSEVSFEEASIQRARIRADRIAAMNGVRPASRVAKKNWRREPFLLRPQGFRPLAILWANLVEVGRFGYPRTCLLISAVLIGGVFWLARNSQYHPFLQVIGLVSGLVPLYALVFTPAVARRSAQRLLDRLETFKAYPLRGWQVVVGQLLASIMLFSWVEWTFLAIFIIAVRHGGLPSQVPPNLAIAAAATLALCVPALAGMLFALNIGSVLYFPAWAGSGQNGPGLERLGQRLIFLVGYLAVLLLALLPATAVAGAIGLLCRTLTDSLPLAFAVSAPVCALILFGELALFTAVLGRRFENFDLSAELPR